MGRTGAGHRRSGGSRRTWTTVVTPAFARDAQGQVTWLAAQDRAAWAEELKRVLRSARALLEAQPHLARADAHGARRLLLGHLPLFLWYRLDEARRRVVWLRLFHVRQRGVLGVVH